MGKIAGFCNFTEDHLVRRPYWEEILRDMKCALAGRKSAENICESLNDCYLDTSLGMTGDAIFCAGNGINALSVIAREIGNVHADAFALDGEIYESDELNGAFAAAIWDRTSKKLYLIRDHVGIKPLFYAVCGDTVVFGSEPKALFAHPLVRPSLSSDGLMELLALGPAHTPGSTPFSDVYEVLPGHIVCIGRDGISEREYWELKAVAHTDSYDETVEKTSFLVRDAVSRQMTGDAPICALLSGGIDSSIVTSIASEIMREQGHKLPTYSFDFTGNDIYFKPNSFQPERDISYVRQMSEYCGTDHTYLECGSAPLASLLADAAIARDCPGMADVDSSLLYFCSLIAPHHTVCLTGECADEIFGGYPWFYKRELLEFDGFPWSRDFEARTALLNGDVAHPSDLFDYSHSRYEETLRKVPHLPDESPDDFHRRNIAYINIKWFMQTLLDRMDRMGSHAGITGRVPFADRRIIEYIFNVPWDMKYKDGVEKSLLRDACRTLLPDALVRRKKSPYPKTYNPGYERLLIEQFTEILYDPYAPITPLIDRRKAKSFLASAKELGRPWYGQLMAGPQLIAYYIQLNSWLKEYNISL